MPATENRPAPDLPLPPPRAPAPPRLAVAAPARDAAAARPAPPSGPAAPSEPNGGSRAAGAVSPPGPLDGVRNPEPEYPLINRERGDQGTVVVRLQVSETGQVTEVEIVRTSGHPGLDEAARKAARRWRYRPALRDGVPIPGNIRTAVHFNLD